MANSNIGVFFKTEGRLSSPLEEKEYFLAYQDLSNEIQKLGANFYIVRNNMSYLGNGQFTNSWKYKNNNIIESGPIKLDALLNKDNFASDGKIKLLNNEAVKYTCSNKYYSSLIFKEFHPKTILAKNKKEFLLALDAIPSKIKVVKPNRGYGGYGVTIGDNIKLKNLEIISPVLIQEFIDTSNGIPGICDSYHDLRMIYINEDLIMTYIRMPNNKNLVSNWANGGDIKYLSRKEIPIEAIEVGNYANKKLAKFGDRYISVDVGISKKGVKIIELNSQVGMNKNTLHPDAKVLNERIAELLVNFKTN